MTKIKICCIANIEEAELAIKYGADAIGLVSEMPSGPGVIDFKTITEISNAVTGRIDTFLLTSKRTTTEIIAQLKSCKTSTVQICDSLIRGSHLDIKKELPNVKIVQVIHVFDESSVDEATEAAKTADALLLDSGNQKLAVKELGGTGRTHNWEFSRHIVKGVKIPVYLAGGLNPANVKEAIKTVHPFGVDICSGLRTDGNLDEAKLSEYVKLVKACS
ncbi:MAG: N-(5'-phosphoribosyl)anthranilate isomerase [Stygiobacter sp. RIFOXYC12_FULL_38_8]|nr:MAG: N-(5'-phosphoribosyl)anthranilate isomerase [Stygiobacter sp. GWC2_38_9]OGV07086.1 MAG: N-(5'-phosphoribosyl)anthranilate isomerase [Stygiobacter sp. RIFOXYB2_FULL_37_11]OGV11024.1 MAG: N-(5'-phosphoribosyl)anthranilate isomerase [Stygiobacter sp. RIFOXYA2_FULL_38_8]OGV12398.1 MAG: N-(5'-phosphoribosyl)anthranilate isomerase [Stygiobacter sp. RIFOXYC2_FULL_38_25]OGV25266.1 MAG: N-(5'-phosphoribosyl)anthranilate isomerase [Stygiobacter sp. RIFOXYC12_FULL_38_8]OGV83050.1 MAG: N-(5'-phosp